MSHDHHNMMGHDGHDMHAHGASVETTTMHDHAAMSTGHDHGSMSNDSMMMMSLYRKMAPSFSAWVWCPEAAFNIQAISSPEDPQIYHG